MKRKIIHIDKEKCNGCGICAEACHEGAIGMVNGKAELLRDDYCDGLGDCLPACPTGAITFVEREALPYNEEAVKTNMMKNKVQPETLACGCPGTHSKMLKRTEDKCSSSQANMQAAENITSQPSELQQWPVQIKLVPVNAPYFDNANLLIAADCSAYAYGNFHKEFMKNKITIIGCPKLDEGDYSEKLTEILKNNNIKSVTIVRMEVPCCSGLANAAINALKASEKMIPWQIVTISNDGRILE
ncbi:ATP-binding protein [Anaerovorax odorimutans]|uniref:ATP-binding protein n=1 Tax=Anaerovorax odorimutans TaxID=109327 RepID=UPI00041EF5D1|nr:4Fe-4S binding protein [Anaerovorax odorimutans]